MALGCVFPSLTSWLLFSRCTEARTGIPSASSTSRGVVKPAFNISIANAPPTPSPSPANSAINKTSPCVGKALTTRLSRHDDPDVTRPKCRLLVGDFGLLQKLLEQGLVHRRRSFQFTQFHGIVVIELALSGRLTHGLFHRIKAGLRQRIIALDGLGHALGFGGDAPLDIPLLCLHVHHCRVAAIVARQQIGLAL